MLSEEISNNFNEISSLCSGWKGQFFHKIQVNWHFGKHLLNLAQNKQRYPKVLVQFQIIAFSFNWIGYCISFSESIFFYSYILKHSYLRTNQKLSLIQIYQSETVTEERACLSDNPFLLTLEQNPNSLVHQLYILYISAINLMDLGLSLATTSAHE